MSIDRVGIDVALANVFLALGIDVSSRYFHWLEPYVSDMKSPLLYAAIIALFAVVTAHRA